MSKNWLDFTGRTCVVTGAGGGIGRAAALALAENGANIVLLERNEDSARESADGVKRLGRKALVVACDASDAPSVEAAAAKSLGELGPCSVLVNTAALLRPGSLDTISVSEWNALLAVNLTGYLLTSQAFGRQMLDVGRGAIVHIASIAASHPQGHSGAYSVSKAGVTMLSRQLATEWGPRGVRSNVVSPGMVETPMSKAFYEAPGVRERRSAVIPIGRIGRPEDMADAVVFLASERAAYVTGQEIVVDGGYASMLMNLVPRPGYDQPGTKP